MKRNEGLILKRGKEYIHRAYSLEGRILSRPSILRKRTREKIYRGIEMCVRGGGGEGHACTATPLESSIFPGLWPRIKRGETFLCRAHGISKGSPGRKVFEIRWIPNKGGAAGIPETGACESSPGHSGSATGISSRALLSPSQTFTAKIFRLNIIRINIWTAARKKLRSKWLVPLAFSQFSFYARYVCM